MDSLLEKLTEWLKEMLITGITDQYSGIFDAVNQQVGNVAAQVGTTFIACMELIQMIVEKNNLSDFDTWMFFKWVFKTLVAVMLVSHTFDITMAVFDIAQNVINNSSGLITSDTAISASAIDGIEASLQDMEVFPLLGVYLQSFLLNVGMKIMSILIFVIVYGRMIEIYLMTVWHRFPSLHSATVNRVRSDRISCVLWQRWGSRDS